MATPLEPDTQYGDYKGKVSLDGFTGPCLHEICRDKGILPKGYFPVAADLYMDNTYPHGDAPALFICSVLAVDTAVSGASADDIIDVAKRDGVLLTLRFDCELSEEDMRKYFKRVSLSFMNSGLTEIDGFELQIVDPPEES